MARPVAAVQSWRTNAELIVDVARLGYLEGRVLDVTYGLGAWWKLYEPPGLIVPPRGTDFTDLPYADRSVDVVAFDPPYRLNGTPDRGLFDVRYGIQVPTRWQDRHALIRAGIVEQARKLRRAGRLLLKCQDQVCSGKVRWQTIEFAMTAKNAGLDLVDRFDLVGPVRAQPPGRRQIHARRNASTLLVFRLPPNGRGTR